MILVDTSIWVTHFRSSSSKLAQLLDDNQVLSHPFVTGELFLSGLVNKQEILSLLEALPRATEASHQEALEVVRRWSLEGRGVGWVDTHLVAAALLSSAQLWTADKRLAAVGGEAGLKFE